MGFGERLKELGQQLQRLLFRHQDKIHGAVDTVGNVANKTTKGKFEDRINKAGEAAHAGVGKVATDPDESAAATDAEGAATDAEGAAGSATADAEGAGESAAGDAEHAGESAMGEAEHDGESAMGDAEHSGDSAMHDAEGAADGHEDQPAESHAEGADYQQPS